MTIRRWVSPVLIAALLGVIAPVNTWAAGAEQTKTRDHSSRLQAAITRAATDAVRNPALQLHGVPVQPTNSGARMQGGGGHTGMIIGLVSTAIGIAATVYTVKALQKSTKNATQQNQ